MNEMNSINECPSPEVLRDLLMGNREGAVAERLLRHLDDCAACRRTLDEADSPSLQLNAASPPAAEDFGPAFYNALGSLAKAHRPTDAKLVGPYSSSRLFDPPSDPSHLGRLAHYDIVAEVGRGGMGVVFHASDTVLQREVAIKILAPHVADRPLARERFAREAQVAATINHDNVLSIHSVAESSGLPYLVMPYIGGRSLAEKIEREGRLPIVDVLRIGLQTATGLAAAHERGVVHRDIKPSNLLLEGTEERVKIADFGLAFFVEGTQLTQSGLIGGTPEFMSPEQANEGQVDSRCDLFSLGVVLYMAATGRSPFVATTSLATLRRVCDHTPPPITQFTPEATAWLAAVVERLLAKNPADRYQNAAEVAESLRQQLVAWTPIRRPAPRVRTAGEALGAADVALLAEPATDATSFFSFEQTKTQFANRFRSFGNRLSKRIRQAAVIFVGIGSLLSAAWIYRALADSDSNSESPLAELFDIGTERHSPPADHGHSGGSRSSRATEPEHGTLNLPRSTSGEPRSFTGEFVGIAPQQASEPTSPPLVPSPTLAIHSFGPAEGVAGDSITLRGVGFTDANKVSFFVRNGSKDAEFKLVSDQELQVVAPEWLTPDSQALIVVETPRGIAVSFPPDYHYESVPGPRANGYSRRQDFCVVRPLKQRNSEYGTTLVESGGALNAPYSGAGIIGRGPYFVRERGIADLKATGLTLFAESDATLSDTTLKSLNVVRTPLISVSSAGVFRYRAAPPPLTGGPSAAVVPAITDIQPRSAQPNEIVSIFGSGFSHVTSVDFADSEHHRRLTPAGFRVVSDNELRAEIPDYWDSSDLVRRQQDRKWNRCFFIISSAAGTTIAARPQDFDDVADSTSRTIRGRIARIKSGGVFSGGAMIAIVEDGGAILESGYLYVRMVHSGGRSDARFSSYGVSFAEPSAIVSIPKPGPEGQFWTTRSTPELTVSPIDFEFLAALSPALPIKAKAAVPAAAVGVPAVQQAARVVQVPVKKGLELSPLAGVLAEDPKLAITDFAPRSGGAGSQIVITGRGFATTHKVTFHVGNAMKIAKFKVVDDGTLNVVAPDWLRDGAEALIVVETKAGLVATAPAVGHLVTTPELRRESTPKDFRFAVVRDGGTCDNLEGAILIERGGIMLTAETRFLEKDCRHGPYFVLNGGNFNLRLPQVIYHEPNVNLASDMSIYVKRTIVPKIVISPVGLFHFTSLPSIEVPPVVAGPPHVTAILPTSAAPADIVELTGHGFAGTKNVFLRFVDTDGRTVEAPFQVVSDRHIRFEVPDSLQYRRHGSHSENPHVVIIIGAGGATFTVGKDQFVKIEGLKRSGGRATLSWLLAPAVSQGGEWVYAEAGTVLTQAEYFPLLFLKQNASMRSTSNFQSGSFVCYETGFVQQGAGWTDNLQRGIRLIEVPAIEPSIVAQPLLILPRTE